MTEPPQSSEQVDTPAPVEPVSAPPPPPEPPTVGSAPAPSSPPAAEGSLAKPATPAPSSFTPPATSIAAPTVAPVPPLASQPAGASDGSPGGSLIEERPEVLAGAAFAGGFLVALILKRLGN